MPNGAVVAFPLNPASVPAGKPELLEQIGEVVANVAIAVSVGVEEFLDGGLTGATCRETGDCLSNSTGCRKTRLARSTSTSWRVGKASSCFCAAMSKHYGAAVPDAALDEIVARPLDVLRKVTARERARMN